MKKYFLFILGVILLLPISLFAKAKDLTFVTDRGQKIKYQLDYDGTVIITGSKNYYKDTCYYIPSEIDGHIVKAIGEDAFKECTNVQRIILPPTLRILMSDAFENLCFEEFVFPDSIKYCSNDAFSWGCLKDFGDLISYAAGKDFGDPHLIGTYKLYKYVDGKVLFKNQVTQQIRSANSIDDIQRFIDEDKSIDNVVVMSKVETTQDTDNRYGAIKEIPADTASYSFKDDMVEMNITFLHNCFRMRIANNSQNTIKIVWDESSFVGIDGLTTPVLEGDTRVLLDNLSNKNTVIIKKATYDGYIFPKSYYDSSLLKCKALVPSTPFNEEKKIYLMIPVQIKDIINEYLMEFTVTTHAKHPELLK